MNKLAVVLGILGILAVAAGIDKIRNKNNWIRNKERDPYEGEW